MPEFEREIDKEWSITLRRFNVPSMLRFIYSPTEKIAESNNLPEHLPPSGNSHTYILDFYISEIHPDTRGSSLIDGTEIALLLDDPAEGNYQALRQKVGDGILNPTLYIVENRWLEGLNRCIEPYILKL